MTVYPVLAFPWETLALTMPCQRWTLLSLAGCCLLLAGGCGPAMDRLELGWGSLGLQPGQMVRPRGVAVDRQSRVFVVDFAGRIQVFDDRGNYSHGWQTPTIVNGRPGALNLGLNDQVIVADSHYYRLLIYSAEGALLKEITGHEGEGPGPFTYLAGVVQDQEGFYYVAEFGQGDRIRKLSPDGAFVAAWGRHGSGQGELARPRGLALSPSGELYVADSCNHRLQVFDREGRWLRSIGQQGKGPGEFEYPYHVAVAGDGTVWVVEFGNHRVQRLTAEGQPLQAWGGPGKGPGQLHNPWGIGINRAKGCVYVADTDNHRIQRLQFAAR